MAFLDVDKALNLQKFKVKTFNSLTDDIGVQTLDVRNNVNC